MGKKMIGIYEITNKINGDNYIGSSVNILSRFGQHKRQLNNQSHCNPHLQNAWNKYGKDNFEFRILEECTHDSIYAKEQKHIDHHAVYNIQRIARPHYHGKGTIKNRQRAELRAKWREVQNRGGLSNIRKTLEWGMKNSKYKHNRMINRVFYNYLTDDVQAKLTAIVNEC